MNYRTINKNYLPSNFGLGLGKNVTQVSNWEEDGGCNDFGDERMSFEHTQIPIQKSNLRGPWWWWSKWIDTK